MITNVELTVQNENGDTISIPLSPLQVKTIFKVLLISPNDENSLNMASDNTLKNLWTMKGNPLRLQEDDQNETL